MRFFIFLTLASSLSLASLMPVETSPIAFTHPNSDGFLEEYNGYLVSKDGTHPLNQLIHKYADEISGLKVIINDEILQNASVRGAYAYRQNNLYLSSQNLGSMDINLIVLHEFVHARIWNRLRKQQPLLLSGLAYNNDPNASNAAYGRFFGLDETVATMFSLMRYKKTFSEKLYDLKSILKVDPKKSKTFKQQAEEIGLNLRTYAGRLTTMLKTLSSLAQPVSFEKLSNPKSLDFLKLDWIELRYENTQVVLPSARAQESRTAIGNFSSANIEKLKAIEIKIFSWGSKTTAKFIQEGSEVLTILEEIESDFKVQFPEEMELINEM